MIAKIDSQGAALIFIHNQQIITVVILENKPP
jgi:hypothetical protein